MKKASFLEKLKQAPQSSFHILDPVKARRLAANTMFIPSPEDVARVISAIPAGETRTIVELRRTLALQGGAETACPGATIKYWKWMAHASEEAECRDTVYDVPWWRVLKDGKPSRHMPGGGERQGSLLELEGVRVGSQVK